MARAPTQRLQDLRIAIDRILGVPAGRDLESLEAADEESLIPICWSFIVIGEAVKTMPKELKDRHPAVDWRGFARFRDVLAHQYFRIDRVLLWKAISVSLPPLDAAVTAELEQTKKGADPKDA
jgi:uncharacterized protein with HEPN domain